MGISPFRVTTAPKIQLKWCTPSMHPFHPTYEDNMDANAAKIRLAKVGEDDLL